MKTLLTILALSFSLSSFASIKVNLFINEEYVRSKEIEVHPREGLQLIENGRAKGEIAKTVHVFKDKKLPIASITLVKKNEKSFLRVSRIKRPTMTGALMWSDIPLEENETEIPAGMNSINVFVTKDGKNIETKISVSREYAN